MNIEWLYGLCHLEFWGYAGIALVMVQTTIMAVTLYLHRDAAHRSLDLHPALRHFFRFWIWMTSGMLTREWVAVHRKHHAFTDKPGDPHSPVNAGLRRILLEGAELYRREARNAQTKEDYGAGTPDDWIERRVYSRHRNAGVIAFVLLQLTLFGVPGIIMIAVQMLAMPVLAAGVINGLGHSLGYRTYEVANAATNIVPWGMVIGGEELHNNHHAFPSSAKFSIQAWEFDAGWLCVVCLGWLGLVKVRRRAPRPHLIGAGMPADPNAVYAVIHNRMHVLRAYAQQVVRPVLELELGRQSRRGAVRASRQLLIRSPMLLDAAAQSRLQELLDTYPMLKTVHDCQTQLRQLWETAHPAGDDVVRIFRDWCTQAEASGIQALGDFARTLRGFSLTEQRCHVRYVG